jgi:hypothetical protein
VYENNLIKLKKRAAGLGHRQPATKHEFATASTRRHEEEAHRTKLQMRPYMPVGDRSHFSENVPTSRVWTPLFLCCGFVQMSHLVLSSYKLGTYVRA